MIFPKESWSEATPMSQNIDPEKLDFALRYMKTNTGVDGIRELTVIRNGYLVWSGDNIDRKHFIWSCTKSITSTLLGILMDDNKCTLDTIAADFVADLKKDYPTITLRHFATMTSGYNSIGPYTYGDKDPLDGSINPLIPAEPIFSPGEKFSYWDNAMRMFGRVLTGIARKPLDEFFKERIGDPIAMRDWSWGRCLAMNDQADGMTIRDAAGGFETTSRELARFGLMLLNLGKWEGRQIVSEAWVKAATSVQVPLNIPLNTYSSRQRGIVGPGVYGYNWWTNGFRINGSRIWPGAPDDLYAALGFNTNRCFIIPSWNMVITRGGTDGEIPDEIENRIISDFFALLKEGTNLGLTQK